MPIFVDPLLLCCNLHSPPVSRCPCKPLCMLYNCYGQILPELLEGMIAVKLL